MVAFNKFFSSIFLSIVYSSFSAAAPQRPRDSQRGTRREHHISRDLKVKAYHPRSNFQTFSSGIDHPLSKRSDVTLGEISASFLASHLGVDHDNVAYRAGVHGATASHAYLRQSHDGIHFSNAVANVALKNNKVIAVGSSFVDYWDIAPSTPSVSVEDAISIAERMLGGTYDQRKTELQYTVNEDHAAVLTHVVQISNDTTGAYFGAFIDAHSGELVSVVDFVARAAYLVVPLEAQGLDERGQVLITDPENITMSPVGWTNDGYEEYSTTQGNNAFAFKSGAGTTMNPGWQFPVDLTAEPDVGTNVDAARTNAFYVVNRMHDITYLYGFTEDAFNFQRRNFQFGGDTGDTLGDDPVLISIQDRSDVNNAQFKALSDGQPGIMTMFLFNQTSPMRDGALQNDIVIHEFTHGVTNRMTGGGTGTCLQTLEAVGLGEGWSDAMAEWVANGPEIDDFVVGAYVANSTTFGRSFPYSTNATVNPLRYSDLQKRIEPHQSGEVWANMLHNVLAALVADHGFSKNAKSDPDSSEGNVVFLHLFMDALQLQPCNPDFISARDAWYQADYVRYDGENICTLQTVFASRGLGLKAADYVDDDTVDADCL